MTNTKIGFLGCGEWAHRKYLPYIKRHPDLQLVAVSNLVYPQEREDIRNDFPNITFFDDHHELCTKAEIDCAIVALPHAMHQAAAKSALENRIPVLVDKPLSVDFRSASSLVQLAAEKGTTLAVSSQRRTQDGNKKIKELVKSGKLGKISWIQSEFSHGSSPNWATTWRNIPELSGLPSLKQGVLLDTGYHMIDVALYILGEFPVSVYAELSHRGHQVDADAVAILNFASGTRATVLVSRLVPPGFEIERVSLLGSNGYAYADKSRFGGHSSERYSYIVDSIPGEIENNERSSALDPFIDFLGHVQGAPLPDIWLGETTLPSLQVIDALYQSAIEHEIVNL